MNNNKVIYSVTRKYMKLNPRRTAITFVGIVFMVMLMTCVFIGKDSVLNYLYKVAECEKGPWHLMTYDLSDDEVQQIAQLPETKNLARTCTLGSIYFPQSGSDKRPYLYVKSYDPSAFDMVNVTVTEGRLPENPNEIVISELALKMDSSVKTGDKIDGRFLERYLTSKRTNGGTFFPHEDLELNAGETIRIPDDFTFYGETDSFFESTEYTGENTEFTVVGFIKQPFFEDSSAGSFLALTVFDQSKGNCNAIIKLDLDKAESAYSVSQKIHSISGEDTDIDTNEMLLVFSAKGNDAVFNKISIFIQIFFVILIMAASIILIYNVFNMSYAERTKYLGMLSSVGATRRQKRSSIYYEAFSLLIPAVPTGMLIGIGVIKAVSLMLKPQLDMLIDSISVDSEKSLPINISVSPFNIILVAVFSIITVLVSSFIPAVKIGKIGAIESIRGNTDKNGKRFRTRFALMKKNRPEQLLAVNGTSRCKHLTKGIVRSIAAFVALSCVTLYGASSVVDVVNIKLNNDETGLISEAEGYDYALIVYDHEKYENAKNLIAESEDTDSFSEKKSTMMGLQYSVKYMSDEYKNAFRSIYRSFFDSDDDPDLIQAVSYIEDEQYQEYLNVIILNDEEYNTVAKRCGADMSIIGDSDNYPAIVYKSVELTTDSTGVFGKTANYKYVRVDNVFNVKTGEILEASVSPEETIELRIAGFADNNDLEGMYTLNKNVNPWIIINTKTAEKCADMYKSAYGEKKFADEMILFSLKENASDELINTLKKMVADDQEHFSLSRPQDLMIGNVKAAIKKIVAILSVCFTLLVSAVCLLNFYNSVKGRAIERKRENAVLRSIGMTNSQMKKMLTSENAILLARGFIVAAIITAACIIFFNKMLTGYFGNIKLDIPWLIFACIAAVATAASVVFTNICYKNVSKESIIETVRNETA